MQNNKVVEISSHLSRASEVRCSSRKASLMDLYTERSTCIPISMLVSLKSYNRDLSVPYQDE